VRGTMKTIQDKRMDMKEAIEQFVDDGDTVYLGGFIQQDPFAAVHEIIRQGKKDLTVSKAAGMLALDLLIGAGSVQRVITSYIWNPIPRPAHAFIRAVQEGIPHKVEVQEVSILVLTLAYFAGALELPFIPVKTLLGSDMLGKNPCLGDHKIQVGQSPFTEEKVCLIPPIRHDVGIIQVQRADPQGNAQAWGFRGDAKYGMLSSRRIIVCAEEIVPHEVILKDPDRTMIPAFRTHAVVEEPWGAHPTYTMGYYDVDWQFFDYYERHTMTQTGFQRFLEEWILGTKSRRHYMEKLGQERMALLRTESWQPEPISYGHFSRHQWCKEQK
jgi:glutaconate CoA-transferase subunit A